MGRCVLQEGWVEISNNLKWREAIEEEETTGMGESHPTNHSGGAIVHYDRTIWVSGCSGVRFVLGFSVHEVWVEPESRLDLDGGVLDDVFLGDCSGKHPQDWTVFYAVLPQSETVLHHQSALPINQPQKQNSQIILPPQDNSFQPKPLSPKTLI